MSTPIREALPSYEVGTELGRGAMGVVLSATHRQLERTVAVKQLPPTFAVDVEVRRRFATEAKTLAALSHPHIVPVYDYVEGDGLCALVMEALPGGTLWDRLTTEGVTTPTACAAVLATCSGLQFAHGRGVLHRDIKPENLMFASDQTLKVTDFGIAHVFSGEETVTTVGGTVLGTPAYMAPEQARGLGLGPPADVYAAGTVLYELLSGTLPFSIEGEPIEVLERRVEADPVPLSEAAPQVPAPLVEVTMRALQRDPGARYESAEAFGIALGNAATEALGEGWLGRAGVNLLATGAIATAAGPAAAPPEAVAGGDVTTAQAGRTGVGTVVTGSAPTDTPAVQVRSTSAHRPPGEALGDLRPEDLVRVDDLISPPTRPLVALVATVLLLIAMLAVAVAGVAEPDRSGALSPGVVTVAGADLGSHDTVSADMATPVPVRVQELPDGAEDAQFAQFGFSAAGVGLGSSRSGPLVPSSGGAFTAEVDAERVRILSSGELTAELRLLDEDKRILLRQEFAVEPEQPFFLAATGIASLLLVLFVAAYGQAITAPLRRGYTRRSAYLGMAILGGVAGFTTVLAAWSLGASEPSFVTFAIEAAVGAVAFGFLARVLIVTGRRRRLRRAELRAAGDPQDAGSVAA